MACHLQCRAAIPLQTALFRPFRLFWPFRPVCGILLVRTSLPRHLVFTRKDVPNLILTINDVRKRLFKFADAMIQTPEFHEKYALFSSCSMEERVDICTRNWDLTMAYIHAIASHLDVEDFMVTATRAVPPEIILTAYVTYWQVTQVLTHMDQNREITVPDADKDFLLYMFADFLGEFSDFAGT